MPIFEKQQQEQSGMIDTLVPPADPMRPRMKFAARAGLFDPTASPSSSPLLGAGSGAGAYSPGTSSSTKWDAPGFGVDAAMKSTEEPKPPSSWKFW